jgi:hypothetical protein
MHCGPEAGLASNRNQYQGSQNKLKRKPTALLYQSLSIWMLSYSAIFRTVNQKQCHFFSHFSIFGSVLEEWVCWTALLVTCFCLVSEQRCWKMKLSQQQLGSSIFWDMTPCCLVSYLAYSLAQRWRQYVPPKYHFIHKGLHDFTS